MIIQYIMFVLIYIFAMLIVGQINLNSKEKSDFFVVTSIAYNFFMGYAIIIIYKLANIYFSNEPKGLLGKYMLPEIEYGFNYVWGVVIVIAYFTCLIPINLYMENSVINGVKYYYKVNIIAILSGVLIYCLVK